MTDTPITTGSRFGDLAWTFFKIGCLSFGGAAAQIAMMHAIIVEEKKWLDQRRFQDALSYCMLLPGPEAQQLATYVGWLTHGVRGGLVAGLLFVLPGALVMLAISILYAAAANLAVVEGLFFGIKAAVLVIIVQALMKFARRGLTTTAMMSLAGLAFIAIALFEVPFPIVIIAAGAVGAVLAVRAPAAVGLVPGAPIPVTPVDAGARRRALVTALGCLVAWWAPVALAAVLLDGGHVVVQVGLFFSNLAVLSFGGAYALLGWLSQAAVDAGWVSPREMIDGLGLAETTPGPTILVTQFVGYLAGLRAAGGLEAMTAAVLAALMATWVTFAPSFLWIFAGAPFVERLRRDPRVSGALTGVTAAVVGVIGWVGLWFALHVMFAGVGETHVGPIRLVSIDLATLVPAALALTGLAAVLAFVFKRGTITLVVVLGALGIAWRLFGSG